MDGIQDTKRLTLDFQKVWQVDSDGKENYQLKEKIKSFRDAGFIVREPKYRSKRFYSCYADKVNYVVVNFDGSLYKCSARDYSDKHKVGVINSKGKFVFNNLFSNYYKHSTFDYEICKKCNILPLCFGPCIQKAFEFDTISKLDFSKVCLNSNTEINIDTYIINKYKNRIK